MFIFILLLVLGTTIWVAVDSKKNQISTHEAYSINTGAVAWVFGCLFLWIAAFPYYLVRRHKILSQRRVSPPPTALGSLQTPVISQPRTQAQPPCPADFDQQLRQLAKLKADGIVSADEFDQKKKALLGL